MLKGLFGGGKNNEKGSNTRKSVNPPSTPAPVAQTKTSDKIMQKPVAPSNANNSVLRNSRESVAGENLAKKAAAAANAAAAGREPTTMVGIDRASSVLEEAAVVFASGESKHAIDTLIKNLNETKGQADKPAWYMLLDAYQATDQQAPFEKLAIYFASRFNTSPPSWEPFDQQEKNERQSLGRNALTIEGSPSVLQKEKIKDFILAAKESKSCRIDLSRMKLLDDDDQILEGLGRVMQTMSTVRKSHFEGMLMGDAHLVDKLSAKVEQSKKNPQVTDQPFWLMLFEILQWRGEESRFEDMALDYAMTFELSPPGYENDGVMTIDNTSEAPVEDGMLNDQGQVVPDNVIDNETVGKLQHAIDERLKQSGAVVVNFQRVRRMDFDAAGSLAGFLDGLKIEKSRVVVQGATELVVALCEITGASGCVTFLPRKR